MDDAQFEFIRKLVQTRVAIVLDRSKDYLVKARLSPIARAEGLASVEHLLTKLQGQAWSALHQQVVEAMTTNETSFFRDFTPFELLRKKIIPQLLTARAKERRLTIWSAACSSGQEIYSTAMLLRENFPQLRDWKLTLLATDFNREMVERTKRGVFSQLEVNRGLPAPLLVKYFKREGLDWKIDDDLRGMVTARPMNLTETWLGLSDMDVVFMRNVLIYFDLDTKKMLLERVRRVLRPDGLMFLGAAETTLGVHSGFEIMQSERALAYRLRSEG